MHMQRESSKQTQDETLWLGKHASSADICPHLTAVPAPQIVSWQPSAGYRMRWQTLQNHASPLLV